MLLLLDRSGSMDGRIALANRAALAIAITLQDIPGCVAAVAAFPGARPERVIPLLEFEEPLSRVAGRFHLTADGSTPLAPALWWAGYQLLCRREARKLVVVVTDGRPDTWDDAQEIMRRCRASGIEVLGLGIQAGVIVNALFGKSQATTIQDIGELAKALFQMLERLFGSVA